MPTNLSIEILSRDFTRILPTSDLRFFRPRYSKHVRGGPKNLSMRVEGDFLSLATLLTYARCPLNVWDGMANKQWWGWIYEAVIYDGADRVGFTMDGMANDIAIFYTQQTVNQRYSSSGEAVETSFLDDDTSVADYGRIQSRIRHGNMDSTAADARRAQELEARKDPMQVYGVNMTGNREPYAILKARGWFDSLAFQYYTNLDGNAAGIEENAVVDSEALQELGFGIAFTKIQFIGGTTDKIISSGVDFGKLPLTATAPATHFFVSDTASNNKVWTVTSTPDGPGVSAVVTPTNVTDEAVGTANIVYVGTKVWQTFELASNNPFYGAAVDIRIEKEAAATDDVTISIYSTTAGAPNAQLATGTITNDEIPESIGYVTAVMGTPTLLSFGVVYGILIQRAAAFTSTHMRIGVDTSLAYSRGTLQLYTDATNGYVARPVNADLIFRISGLVATTTQIGSIVTTSGEFITATQIDDASGLNTPPYRDGLNDAREYILDLLRAGTSANKRELATVDPDRRLIVYVEPTAGGASDFLLSGDGEIRQRDDSVIPRHFCTYGQWSKVKKYELLAGIDNVQFIEEVEYDGETDKYTQIILKNRLGDFELFNVS